MLDLETLTRILGELLKDYTGNLKAALMAAMDKHDLPVENWVILAALLAPTCASNTILQGRLVAERATFLSPRSTTQLQALLDWLYIQTTKRPNETHTL